MLRQTSTIAKNLRLLTPLDMPSLVETSTCYQCVRWRRKPRWLPVAKSKMFRVPERHQTPEEELIELRRLQNNYNLQIRSIRGFLIEQVKAASMTVDNSAEKVRLEEEDFARCMKINDEWNAGIAKIREERLEREEKEMKEKIIQELIDAEEKEKERLEEIEKLVREEKEKAKSYITADNIDEAIERALGNEVDFNFAIDLEGNIYRGRHTKPPTATPQDAEKVQVSAQAGS